jgi:hypothetical protein
VSHTTSTNFKRPFRDIPRGEKRMELKDIPSNGEVDSVAVNVFFLFQLPSMRIPTLLASVFILASRPCPLYLARQIRNPGSCNTAYLAFFWSIHTFLTMLRQHILPSWGFLAWPSLLGLVGFVSPLFRFAGGLEGALLYLLLAIHIGQGDWICPGLARLCWWFPPKNQ